jgi:hypothetical protein
MKRICVFCGSSAGDDPTYAQGARLLGGLLAQRNLGLVYGGGKVGLMGQVAHAAMERGGEVIGVIPRWLQEKELALTTITELRVVETMHERKTQMVSLADGFIALPGGLGTLEELSEVWTWGQLGLHTKPCGILNVRGYYDGLLEFLDRMEADQFIAGSHRHMVIVERDAERLLDRMEQYQAPAGDKAKWALRMHET